MFPISHPTFVPAKIDAAQTHRAAAFNMRLENTDLRSSVFSTRRSKFSPRASACPVRICVETAHPHPRVNISMRHSVEIKIRYRLVDANPTTRFAIADWQDGWGKVAGFTNRFVHHILRSLHLCLYLRGLTLPRIAAGEVLLHAGAHQPET